MLFLMRKRNLLNLIVEMLLIDRYVLMLLKRYKHTPDDIEIGYENEIFVYCLLYRGENSLIYAFYGIDDGEFIKAYRIDNSR